MLKIQRSTDKGVTLLLSGRIEADDIVELQRLLDLEVTGQDIALDLQDITLIDRAAVKFLARWQEEKIRLVNCPAYIQEWIDRERVVGNRQES